MPAVSAAADPGAQPVTSLRDWWAWLIGPWRAQNTTDELTTDVLRRLDVVEADILAGRAGPPISLLTVQAAAALAATAVAALQRDITGAEAGVVDDGRRAETARLLHEAAAMLTPKPNQVITVPADVVWLRRRRLVRR